MLRSLAHLVQDEGLVIDWSRIKFYNTIMAVAAGAALASLARVIPNLVNRERLDPRGWAVNFGALGLILFGTGMHMTLTWPLAPTYAADNISFGEPTAILGALTLVMAFYFWKTADAIRASDDPAVLVCTDFRSFRYILYGAGFALISTGMGGPIFKLYTAPKEEPIAGLEAVYGFPYATSYLIAGLWIAIGLVAIYFPWVMEHIASHRALRPRLDRVALHTLRYSGFALLFIGGSVYFTHLGMILNTTSP